MSTAISGLNTTLYCGDSATALTKLCDIKDVPDLISEPNLLDATTLSDPMQVNIFGIIQSDTKSFTANYNKTDYKKVKEAGYDETSESNAVKYYALKMQEKYDIRCTSVEQETRNLSGGNQQKVILARELEGSPDLLVAVHPTRGLDIGATRFVHDTMIEARDKGCGVLLISADFDEILEVSDRIVVMFEGQIMGVFSGKNPPIEEISLAMAGK